VEIERWSAEGRSLHTKRAFIISFSHFFHDIYGAFLSPVLPVLIEKFGLSLRLAGLLLPVFRSPTLLQPLLSYQADRGKLTKLFPLTLVVTALTMSTLPLSPGYGYALALIFVAGISASVYHAFALPFISSASGNRPGTGMSLFMTGGELARSFGPLLIVTSLRLLPGGAVPLAALPGLAYAALLLFSPLGYTGETQKSRAFSFRGLRRGSKDIGLLVAIGMAHSLTVYTFSLYLPTHMKQGGATLFTAGISLTALQISGAAGALLGGTLSDRLGRKPFFLITATLVPLLINLFLQARTDTLKMLLLLATGVFMFSSTPVRYASAQELVPDMRGTASSILMSFNFLTSVLASIVGGFLGDSIGLHDTYRILSFIPLIEIPLILMLSNKSP